MAANALIIIRCTAQPFLHTGIDFYNHHSDQIWGNSTPQESSLTPTPTQYNLPVGVMGHHSYSYYSRLVLSVLGLYMSKSTWYALCILLILLISIPTRYIHVVLCFSILLCYSTVWLSYDLLFYHWSLFGLFPVWGHDR